MKCILNPSLSWQPKINKDMVKFSLDVDANLQTINGYTR
jgi:hypothetical protein